MLAGDSPAADADHRRRLRGEASNDLTLDPAKVWFAVLLEGRRDGSAFAVFDEKIGIDVRPAQFTSQQSTHDRLAASAIADQDHMPLS